MAAKFALTKGIILADTKFEFGIDPKTGELVLADEVLTPDSSRYWPADKYVVGQQQPSLDKQYVRDWLESIKFDKTNPVLIDQDVVQQCAATYGQLFTILT